MNRQPFWEREYLNPDAHTFGYPDKELCKLAPSFPKNSKALDLGCGDGRHTIYLAENGFDVTALDISQNGIAKLNKRAKKKNLSIKTVVQDARGFDFKENYDLIIAYGFYHLIEKKHQSSLIFRCKEHTSSKGFNIVSVFTNRVEWPDDAEDICVGVFNEGEIFEYYKDWDIKFKKSFFFSDEHPGGIQHTHPINQIIAQKP